jgi:hypothetical protein
MGVKYFQLVRSRESALQSFLVSHGLVTHTHVLMLILTLTKPQWFQATLYLPIISMIQKQTEFRAFSRCHDFIFWEMNAKCSHKFIMF